MHALQTQPLQKGNRSSLLLPHPARPAISGCGVSWCSSLKLCAKRSLRANLISTFLPAPSSRLKNLLATARQLPCKEHREGVLDVATESPLMLPTARQIDASSSLASIHFSAHIRCTVSARSPADMSLEQKTIGYCDHHGRGSGHTISQLFTSTDGSVFLLRPLLPGPPRREL